MVKGFESWVWFFYFPPYHYIESISPIHPSTSLQLALTKRRMNTSSCESISGCESGWTTYLDQLSNSTYPYTHNRHGKGANVHDHDQQDIDDDEDLSMVSDASSGPPHLHGGAPPQSAPPRQQERKQRTKTRDTKLNNKNRQHSFCLDDTASSPFLHFSQASPTIFYLRPNILLFFEIKVFHLINWNGILFSGQYSSTWKSSLSFYCTFWGALLLQLIFSSLFSLVAIKRRFTRFFYNVRKRGCQRRRWDSSNHQVRIWVDFLFYFFDMKIS